MCNFNMEETKENISESMFNWSPLPERKLFVSHNENELDEMAENLYPNCDTSACLRSCEKEVLEPLQGTTIEWINGTLIRNGPGSIKMEYVEFNHLFDSSAFLVRINYEKYLGEEYRYFYAISSDIDCDNPGMLIKVDTLNKATLTWCDKNCYPSEPVFIANPNSQFEDDGIILSAIIWGENETNQVGILVLNATTFQEIGRTVFKTASSVPKCLHGWFLENKSEKCQSDS